MGKPLHEIYPYATKFQVFKWKLGKFIRKTVFMSTIVLALSGAGLGMGIYLFPRTVTAVQNIPVDNLGPKIEQLKNEVLASLKTCESNGYSESDAPIIFDSNNKASIGVYQWQKASVIHYYKTLYGKTITPKEAVLIALDEKHASQLTSDVLFTTEKGYTNWKTCSSKLDIPSQIGFIKKLEK